MLICCWLCCVSPSPKPGSWIAMVFSPAAFPGAQLHHMQRSYFQVVVLWTEPGSFHTFPHTFILVTSSLQPHLLSCITRQISSISYTLSLGFFSCTLCFHSFLTAIFHLPLMPLYFWQLSKQHMFWQVQSYVCAAQLASVHMLFTRWSNASCSGGGLSYPFLSSFVALLQYSPCSHSHFVFLVGVK